MNREDTIKLARQAGIDEWWDSGDEQREVLQDHLKRFAELVAAEIGIAQHRRGYESGLRDGAEAERNRLADKLQQDFKQSFGADTCASWASWLRSQK